MMNEIEWKQIDITYHWKTASKFLTNVFYSDNNYVLGALFIKKIGIVQDLTLSFL